MADRAQLTVNAILIILGVMGLGAIIISAFVFTVAARNYVSEDEQAQQDRRKPVARGSSDRRRGEVVSFPLTVNGIIVTEDRRRQPDRRRHAA